MIRLLLLTFLCLASLSAMEEGLKIRIPQAEQTVRVSIEEEANIRAEDRLQPLAKIKENTLAAALPDTGKDYVWIPGWDLTGTGALRVADAAAVLDGSVAAFLETVGKCEEAQGGRIILLDVLRKRIAGYFTVGRKLSALRLGNTLEYAVAFAEAQPVLKQPAGFVVLDLKEGKERSFHRTDKPVSFAVAGASLFFADAKGAVRMLNLEDGDSKTLFRAPCPLLRVSPDGTAVIAAAEDAFYRIDAASGEVASKEPRKERFRIGELPLFSSARHEREVPSVPSCGRQTAGDCRGFRRAFCLAGERTESVCHEGDQRARLPVGSGEPERLFLVRAEVSASCDARDGALAVFGRRTMRTGRDGFARLGLYTQKRRQTLAQDADS